MTGAGSENAGHLLQQPIEPFLLLEPADEHEHPAAAGDAQARQIGRCNLLEMGQVDAVGNHQQASAGRYASRGR